MDYSDYVISQYQQYLGRTPSADEIAFVNNALNSGYTLYDLTAGIQGSPEYQQLTSAVQADPSSRVSQQVDAPQTGQDSPFATPSLSPVSTPVNATLQQAVNYLTNQQSTPYINNASLLQPHAPNSVVTDTSGAPIAIYDASGNLSTWHDNKGVVHNISELQFQTPTYMRNPTYSSDLGAGANNTGEYISAKEAAAIGVPFDNTPQLTQDSAAKLTVDMGGKKGESFVNWGMLSATLGVPLMAALGPVLIGQIANIFDPGVWEAAQVMGTGGAAGAAPLSSGLSALSSGLLGAGKNAALALASGKDPLMAAVTGAISSGASPYLSSEISSAIQDPTGRELANALKNIGVSAATGYASGGVTGAEAGALGAAATEGLGAVGKTAASAFEPDTVEWSREDQPAANYVIDAEGNFQLDKEGNPLTIEEWRKQNTDVLAKSLKTIGAPFISQNISNLFASSPSSSSSSASGSGGSSGSGVSTSRTSKTGIQPTYTGSYSTPTYSNPRQSSGSVTTGQGSVGTQALAQALNVGDPSKGTSDVDSPATGGQQQNVWNQESLRVKDATGSSPE